MSLPDRLPPGEQAADELGPAQAIVVLQRALQQAQPAFREHRGLRDLRVTKLRRGVALDCTFTASGPVRVVISTAWSRVLLQRLRKALRV
jgi:hypothetical protein